MNQKTNHEDRKHSESVIYTSNNNLNGIYQLGFKLQHEIFRKQKENS